MNGKENNRVTHSSQIGAGYGGYSEDQKYFGRHQTIWPDTQPAQRSGSADRVDSHPTQQSSNERFFGSAGVSIQPDQQVRDQTGR